MKIKKKIFDACYVLELSSRDDIRANMQVIFRTDELYELTDGFVIKEQRIYTMPKKGTFFGIHFQDSQSKLISVIHGRGLDYIVDLRRDSPTYMQYKTVELSGDDDKAVFIPSGFGHGFLSLKADTLQLFAVDEQFDPERSKTLNYRAAGIELPFEDIIISEKDLNAPYLDDAHK